MSSCEARAVKKWGRSVQPRSTVDVRRRRLLRSSGLASVICPGLRCRQNPRACRSMSASRSMKRRDNEEGNGERRDSLQPERAQGVGDWPTGSAGSIKAFDDWGSQGRRCRVAPVAGLESPDSEGGLSGCGCRRGRRDALSLSSGRSKVDDRSTNEETGRHGSVGNRDQTYGDSTVGEEVEPKTRFVEPSDLKQRSCVPSLLLAPRPSTRLAQSEAPQRLLPPQRTQRPGARRNPAPRVTALRASPSIGTRFRSPKSRTR